MSDATLTPRPHQVAATSAILSARQEGRPGFLLGDLTGLGKTLSVWAAVATMPEDDILIVCPKGGMPQWRRRSLHPWPNSQGFGPSAVGKTLTRLRETGDRPSSPMNLCMSSSCLLAMPSQGDGWM